MFSGSRVNSCLLMGSVFYVTHHLRGLIANNLVAVIQLINYGHLIPFNSTLYGVCYSQDSLGPLKKPSLTPKHNYSFGF